MAESNPSYSIADNLDKLRKIRNDRKVIYNNERPEMYKI